MWSMETELLKLAQSILNSSTNYYPEALCVNCNRTIHTPTLKKKIRTAIQRTKINLEGANRKRKKKEKERHVCYVEARWSETRW